MGTPMTTDRRAWGAAHPEWTVTGEGHQWVEGPLVGVVSERGVVGVLPLEVDGLAEGGEGPRVARPWLLAAVAMEALRSVEFGRGAVIEVGRGKVLMTLAGWKGAAR